MLNVLKLYFMETKKNQFFDEPEGEQLLCKELEETLES